MSYRDRLPRTRPEDEGVSPELVLRFVDAVEANALELHSLMLLRRGKVVSEGWWAPYGPERPHLLFSLTKSFTSTAVGFAVQEGLLSTEDEVVSFFPEHRDAETERAMAGMRVKHLLMMGTGHVEDTMDKLSSGGDDDWANTFLHLPVDREPGTHFLYNTGASHVLSAIVQRVSGEPLRDYLQPRLFEPLGIEPASWERDPRGIQMGGFGLSLRTEDIAKFGQLYLQQGVWNGKRLLGAEWIAEATRKQIANGDNPSSDWNQGYGYQFWRCRHGAYRGDGAFGQYCIVFPEHDAVLAITSGLGDMQAVLDQVWEHLLPAFAGQPLPRDDEAQARLTERLSALRCAPPPAGSASPLAGELSGRQWTFGDNPIALRTARFSFRDDVCEIAAEGADGTEFRIACGFGRWIEGTVPGIPYPKTEACATWIDERTLQLTCRLVLTPFTETVRIRFEGERVQVQSRVNVAFGERERPSFEGIAEG